MMTKQFFPFPIDSKEPVETRTIRQIKSEMVFTVFDNKIIGFY